MQRIRAYGWKRIVLEIIPLILFLFFVFSDQITKDYFHALWEKHGDTVVIDKFFYFTYTVNTGSAFSFLAGKAWAQTFFKILTPLTLILFILLYIHSIKRGKKFLYIATISIFSGAIGNYIDRLIFSGVTDFISLKFGSYNFPVFNFADICLTVGVIMFIIFYAFLDTNAIFNKHGKK